MTYGDIARAVFAEVYGAGSDKSYDIVNDVYRKRCMAAAERIVKLLRAAA